MAWVEQVADRSWRVRYRASDGQTRSVSGLESRDHAEQYAAGIEAQRRRVDWVDPGDGRITLEHWTRRWWPSVTVAERTAENYRRDLRNHILPRWGECRLAEITTSEVNLWAGEKVAAGYAPATVSSLVKLLSRLLTDAVDANLINVNPVRLRRRRGPRVLTPQPERVWATPEQVLRVAEHACALGGATPALLILTGAWTGARWGELAGLVRDNVHLDDGVIVIDRRLGALHESGQRLWLAAPKTEASVRVITLPPFLIDLLREHLRHTRGVPVFAGPHGGWLRRSNLDRRVLRPAADGNLDQPHVTVRVEPVCPGLTFHGLRHSHKTWLIADGVPEIAQARRLGHHLPDRVVETYSHVAPEVEQRLLDGLQARWWGANLLLHPDQPRAAFRSLLIRVGRWPNPAL
ncbi:MAG TPA: tyrosine-type recombinase/integrase [Mycobacterium sp.]|jgi:integrase|nr:tyrosine-type recombinase/integrase [Mycobacterium sp.]